MYKNYTLFYEKSTKFFWKIRYGTIDLSHILWYYEYNNVE